MSKITFRIKKDGTITAEVNGVVGPICKDLTLPFTSALGSVIEVSDKTEYYDQIDTMETVLYETEEEK